MALSRLPAATLAWSTSSASLSSSMIVSARHCLHLSRCWMHIPLTHAAFTRALIRASPIPRKLHFSLSPHRVAFGTVHEPRRHSGGTRLPRRAWLRGSQSSELCPRLGDFRRFPTNMSNFAAAHPRRSTALRSTARQAQPERELGSASGRLRTKAHRERARRPPTPRPPTQSSVLRRRNRVLRARGAPGHARRSLRRRSARSSNGTHRDAPAHPQRPSAPSLAPSRLTHPSGVAVRAGERGARRQIELHAPDERRGRGALDGAGGAR